MKTRITIALTFLLLSLFSCKHIRKQQTDSSQENLIAQRPPMGWNSWNCFGVTVTEKEVRANAAYMATHLKHLGWEYVVVDLGWYLPPTLNTATFKVQQPSQRIDNFGRLLPDTVKFPSASEDKGFKPLADYVHSLGLKFGIHIMRGIPWQADHNKLKIKGTDILCSVISNPEDSCNWYAGMYGVNTAVRGAQEYYNSLVELYTSWGVDYIKADDMSSPYHPGEIAALHNAIEKHGNKIVLSLSPGPAPLEKADHLKTNANLWRISPDFWDHWSFLKKQFELCNLWSSHVRPGGWPDADMLPLGKLRVTGPDDYVAKHMGLSMEEITNEYSRFTTEEKYSLMTLWSIFRSPLMMGGHLPETDTLTFRLLTNEEVIRVNQFSNGGKQIFAEGGLIAWSAVDENGDHYLALFNTNDDNAERITVPFSKLGIDAEKQSVRDLWKKRDLGKYTKEFSALISPHGAGLYRLH